MPRLLVSWAKKRAGSAARSAARAKNAGAVVKRIQQEAKENGATLANDGKGGVDPRLALKLFRRAKWRCENPDCPDPKKDLDLDHLSGHPKEILAEPDPSQKKRLKEGAKEGHVDTVKALHVLCHACHDRVHDRERAIEKGKQPPPMRGSA